MNSAKARPVASQNTVLVIPPGGSSSQPPPNSSQPQFRELELLAKWLDSIFQIPGLNIRFGLDALLGLIPGLGDTATSAASLYILLTAAKNGVPRITLLRMAANIGIDYVVGSIPLLGDLFDVYWKANQKNVELLQRNAQADNTKLRKMQFQDWFFVGGLAFLLIATLVGSIMIAYWLLSWIIQLARGSAA